MGHLPERAVGPTRSPMLTWALICSGDLAAGVLGEEEMQGLVWTGVQFTRDFPIDYSLLLVGYPANCAEATTALRSGL